MELLSCALGLFICTRTNGVAIISHIDQSAKSLLWVHWKNESLADRTIRHTSSAVLIGCDFTVRQGQSCVYISEDEAREIHVCFTHVHHHFNCILRWRTRKTRRRGERGKEGGEGVQHITRSVLKTWTVAFWSRWMWTCDGSEMQVAVRVSWTWGEEGGFVKKAGSHQLRKQRI